MHSWPSSSLQWRWPQHRSSKTTSPRMRHRNQSRIPRSPVPAANKTSVVEWCVVPCKCPTLSDSEMTAIMRKTPMPSGASTSQKKFRSYLVSARVISKNSAHFLWIPLVEYHALDFSLSSIYTVISGLSHSLAMQTSHSPAMEFPRLSTMRLSHQHGNETVASSKHETVAYDSNEPSHAQTKKPSHLAIEPPHLQTMKPSHLAIKPPHLPTMKPSHAATMPPSHSLCMKPSHQAGMQTSHRPFMRR